MLIVFRWGGISTLFLEWAPSINANIFSHLEEMLNISTANDSTYTVVWPKALIP